MESRMGMVMVLSSLEVRRRSASWAGVNFCGVPPPSDSERAFLAGLLSIIRDPGPGPGPGPVSTTWPPSTSSPRSITATSSYSILAVRRIRSIATLCFILLVKGKINRTGVLDSQIVIGAHLIESTEGDGDGDGDHEQCNITPRMAASLKRVTRRTDEGIMTSSWKGVGLLDREEKSKCGGGVVVERRRSAIIVDTRGGDCD